MKRLRLLASIVSVLVLLGLVAIGWIYSRVRASLPQLDGTTKIAGLAAPVTIMRDDLGVPTLHGETRIDVARALGFVHAQDRFFQMDVWRRAAAGELAEVFGPKTVAHDRAMRMHGFRELAKKTLALLPADQRALLDAYTDGVNAGLAGLREKPFEYLVVRATPAPWKPEDTLLVCDAMLTDLQDDTGRYELTLMALRDQLGAAGIAFFAPLITPVDAALDGSTAPVAQIPGPEVVDLRRKSTANLDRNRDRAAADEGDAESLNAAMMRHRSQSITSAPSVSLPIAAGSGDTSLPQANPFSFLERDPGMTPGSNAFALAGAHTATGAALLASDMHLSLRVPNIWYRASLEFPGHKITGVTLAGVPLVVAGSNGHVAWSFTNSYADTGDLIVIDLNPIAPSLYRAPGHADLLTIEKRHEAIRVQGAPTVNAEYDWTIWGPIVGHDEKGRPLAFLWTGHDPAATNLDLIGMEDATDVRSAVAVAHRIGLPAENMVIADTAGDVAWTIAGRLPRRVGYDGRSPVTFQFGDRAWDGFVPPNDVPVVTTRPTAEATEAMAKDGRIWSANQRMLGGAALATMGDGGYGRPARAAQIRDALAALEHATPRDMLNIQLDDRALFLTPWNKLLLDTLTPEVTKQKEVRATLRSYAEKWEGRASAEAVSYPIARIFRIAVYTRVFPPIFASCLEENPQMRWNQLQLERAIWTLLREKPAHLLDPQYASWDALLVAAIDDTIRELDRAGVRLPYATWGQRNAAEIRHPFSYTLPWFFRSTLDMPSDPLPGDVDMPRVQAPSFGASERFVVSPGHEAEGIFEMPCGQSGHPLSPYYRAGHEAWVKGAPTPFLPGKPEHTLMLEPK